ncbi:TrbI/VirB10 family protein [Luteimonas sp. e5]
MSSNYPPDYSANPQEGRPEDAERREAGQSNPYMQQGDAGHDLDEGAPTLTVNEVRQLNRKALFFLAGIVLTMLLMAFWFMTTLTNRDTGASQATAPAPVIETPELPEQPPVAVAPVEVITPPPPPPPPVLPPDDYMYSDAGGGPAAPAGPTGPSLLERRMGNSQLPPDEGMPGQIPGMGGMDPESATAVATVSTPKTSAKRLANPNTLLVRGTYIRCVLETRIVTDLGGATSCVVAEPIYSINGRSLLLPVGTKLLGTYGNDTVARDRVAVVWDRAITPTGLDVTMSSPGVDSLGGSGHPGQRNAHWGNRIATAVLVSLISDAFKYAGEKHGPRGSVYYPGSGMVVDQPFQSNTARTVESLAQQAVQDSALRQPTITINQGSMLNVYVSQDVDFTGVLSGR